MDANIYINLGRVMPMKEVDRKLYKMLSFKEKVGYLVNKFKQNYIVNNDKGLEGSV
jgi:hypothetical protein